MRGPLIWNLVSFAGVALVGILLNLLVGAVYSPSVLGIFNQAVTLYIFAAQLAVLGVHHFTLQRMSVNSDGSGGAINRVAIGETLWPSLACAGALGAVTSAAALSSSDFVLWLFDSQGVVRAWEWTAPALFFFSVNKVLLNTFNGLSWFRLFASFNLLRYLLLLAAMLVFFAMSVAPELLAGIFFVAEAVLFCLLLPTVLLKLRPTFPHGRFLRGVREALRFGTRSALGGALSEFNTRIDILVLGIFLDDAKVGVYSIIALIFEGLGQLGMVVRNILNPRLARGLADRDKPSLEALIHRAWLWTALASITLSVIALGLYEPFVDLALRDPAYQEGFWPLAVLLAGLSTCTGMYVLDMLFLQGNRPGVQTLFKSGVVMTNLAANFALVPSFGLIGAAAGTVISLVLGQVLMCRLSLSMFGVRVLPGFNGAAR